MGAVVGAKGRKRRRRRRRKRRRRRRSECAVGDKEHSKRSERKKQNSVEDSFHTNTLHTAEVFIHVSCRSSTSHTSLYDDYCDHFSLLWNKIHTELLQSFNMRMLLIVWGLLVRLSKLNYKSLPILRANNGSYWFFQSIDQKLNLEIKLKKNN